MKNKELEPNFLQFMNVNFIILIVTIIKQRCLYKSKVFLKKKTEHAPSWELLIEKRSSSVLWERTRAPSCVPALKHISEMHELNFTVLQLPSRVANLRVFNEYKAANLWSYKISEV